MNNIAVVECKQCSKLITAGKRKPRKFCSTWPCYQTWWRRNIKNVVDKHSKEFSQKMKSLDKSYLVGEKNHNWAGGVTSENEKCRKSRAYIEWRKSVFERDNYTCQFCGIRGGELQADHIKPFALYPDLRLEISNGRTLCVPCHRTTFIFIRTNNQKLCPAFV